MSPISLALSNPAAQGSSLPTTLAGGVPAVVPPIAPVVALDIGNVCVHLEYDRQARQFGYASFADLNARNPELMPWTLEFETGAMHDESAFLAGLAARLPVTFDSAAALIDAWNSNIGDEIAGLAALVRRIRGAGLQVVYLSDICPIHHRYIDGLLSFASEVDDGVMSYRVGTLKPGDAMYLAMEAGHCGGGVPALYLDDKPGNIAAARRRGWRAYQFGTVEGANRELDLALREIDLLAGEPGRDPRPV